MKTKHLRRLLLVLGLIAGCYLQTGCAMCCGTYDYAYAGQCGKYERSDMFNGRVGSPFSDPNLKHSQMELIDSNQTLDETQLELIE